ncbi:MAG TPA: hypothetical protein PLW31_10810 [Bacteroidales bacterium]|nr:hypothetical protein [Bacteroidales bacterium]
MLKKILYRTMIVMLVLSLAGGMGACKSKKKLAKEKEAAEYAAKLNTVKTTLLDILNDNTAMSLEEKEAAVRSIKNMNLNDPEIDELIRQAEAKLAAERAALKKQQEPPKTETVTTTDQQATAASLSRYFSSIAGSTSVSQANVQINEALKLFTSPDVPVLIIISKENNIVDYDRPTTIKDYLNYLKDTKNNINKVDKVILDNSGKIKELELLKTY